MNLILGIDEVGRGPWAGPLVIGACVLKPRFDEAGNPETAELWQENLRDSKKLTAKKREELSQEIRKKAVAFSLGWVSSEELDEIGLSEALNLATRRAVKNLNPQNFSEIIIDGTQNFLKNTKYAEKVTVLKKADDKIKEVSAASILAKVARDNYMIELGKKYPVYGFEGHMGYGTTKHKAALEAYGPCPEHRFSFRPVAARTDARPKTCTTAIGAKAEEKVAEYLKSRGHKILARNYKTKFCEIDIVSATKNHVYFTEVKYRKNHKYGDPLEFINAKKLRKMTLGAEFFMKILAKKMPEKTLPSPLLAAAAVSGADFTIEKWLEIPD